MAYVGTPIDTRNQFQSLQGKRFNGDGSTTDFTLDVAPSSTLDIEVFVGNVRQDPNSAYTLSGTTLSFTGAPPSGTNNIYVVHQAKAVGTINPGANTVGITELNVSDGSNGQVLQTNGSGTLSFTAGSPITALNNATANELVTVGSTTTELDAESALTYDGTTFLLTQASPKFKILPTTNGNDGVIEICGRSTDGSPTENRTQIKGEAEGSTANTKMTFHVENSSGVNERMRLTSNGVLELGVGSASDATDMGIAIGKDQNSNKRLTVYGSHGDLSGLAEFQTSQGSGDNPLIHFTDGNNQNCGEITLDASANTVAYSTSSDYRLKENVVAISDGITRVKNLKPYRFNFITKPEQTVDGFFAHEAQTVVPEAVNGTKDAMKTVEDVVVNADGTVETWGVKETEWTAGKTSGKYASDSTWEATKEVIDRQGIDQSKLIPLLTAALKEAITKIEALEARVTTLEG